jgi:hypothetical protein
MPIPGSNRHLTATLLHNKILGQQLAVLKTETSLKRLGQDWGVPCMERPRQRQQIFLIFQMLLQNLFPFFLHSFCSEEQVIASHWLEEYENSTSAYLITNQFNAALDQ